MGLRVSTAVLRERGVLAHDPSRARERAGEPEPTEPLGPPPEYLTADEKAAWDKVVLDGHLGVFCKADRIIVEMVALLLVDLWRCRGEMLGPKMATLAMLLSKLGMTPADRSRVSTTMPGKAKTGGVANFIKRK